MGSAADYVCESCGYRAREVTGDFDFGRIGVVVAPVVCPKHGIVCANTGLNAWDEGWTSHKRGVYPCPHCGSLSATWDRCTCPDCGQKTMGEDPHGIVALWD